MKKLMMVLLFGVCAAGCGSLRFSPTEAQKRNAWSHMQTTRATATTAREDDCTARVCSLAALGARQAEAFAADYGMPEELPEGGSVEEILAEANWKTADAAMTDSQQRLDGWAMADGVLEFGAGLAGLFGGAFGAKLLRSINEARAKSKALKEIVEGNELFKKRNPSAASDFKEAQCLQSQETRELVASLK